MDNVDIADVSLSKKAEAKDFAVKTLGFDLSGDRGAAETSAKVPVFNAPKPNFGGGKGR